MEDRQDEANGSEWKKSGILLNCATGLSNTRDCD